jgi:hypothetical protein
MQFQTVTNYFCGGLFFTSVKVSFYFSLVDYAKFYGHKEETYCPRSLLREFEHKKANKICRNYYS